MSLLIFLNFGVLCERKGWVDNGDASVFDMIDGILLLQYHLSIFRTIARKHKLNGIFAYR